MCWYADRWRFFCSAGWTLCRVNPEKESKLLHVNSPSHEQRAECVGTQKERPELLF